MAQKPVKPGAPPQSEPAVPSAAGRTRTPSDGPPDWSARRTAKPANYLLRPALEWFKQLPSDVRPVALADQYPRVLNLIVSDWNTPGACRARLDDLLSDRRGSRQGFPANIQAEIRVLRGHYDRSHLTLQD